MIVLGADMHKSSHTLAAVAAITGELLGDKTAPVGARGFGELWTGRVRSGRSVSGRWRTAGMCRGPLRLLDRAWRACRARPDALDGSTVPPCMPCPVKQ